MSPVSTTIDPTIGYAKKYGTGLSFDPIASRNPDRPKFRLDTDKDAGAARETDPRRSSSEQPNAERKGDDRRPDRVRDSRSSALADPENRSAEQSVKKEKPVEDTPVATPLPTVQNTDSTTNAGASAEDAENAGASAEAADAAPGAAAATNKSETAGTSAAKKQGDAVVASGEQAAKTEKTETEADSNATNRPELSSNRPELSSQDPKLTALQNLTQPSQSADTTTRATSDDDTTAFKLPVPWPPLTNAEAPTTPKGGVTAQNAANQSPSASAPQVNQDIATQTQAATAGAEESLAGEGSKKTAATASTKVSGEPVPKIEVVSQAPAKPAAATDVALVTNNRMNATEGTARQAVLPTSSETIAAATALNNRSPRSNALTGSSAQRSNAVTASNENSGAKLAGTQGQQSPAVATQITQANPAATAFAAATQPQTAVTSPEQVVQVRQQPSSVQRGQNEQTSQTSGASRAADLPGQATSSGFTDSLRAASADRTTATHDRQSLPTPATEQVKVKLVKAAQGGLDKIKIQLNPSELGKVEVRLEIGSDGSIRGTIIADKPETMDHLQRDAKQLERALQDAGFKTGGDGLDFQMRGGGTNERQQQNAGSGNGPLSQDGGDLKGSEEQPAADTTGSEHDGIGDDGSLNLVA